ncbi:MAG: carbon storage regulator [Planctomycetaceae bacterium]|nr:carbon storage regulator [Planctomycetaceae bacterium]
MLVLSRKPLEAVVVGGADGFARLLKVTVLEIKHGSVRLGFEAPAEVPVHRWEIWERIQSGDLPGKGSGEIDQSVVW